jgi:hypothetical protein
LFFLQLFTFFLGNTAKGAQHERQHNNKNFIFFRTHQVY